VIRIRYEDLPGGLHARAEPRGKDVIIYLLPGLTPSQRKAAVRRLRAGARMGPGPGLSAAGLARARLADWARVNGRNVFAALRLHPLVLIPSIVIVLTAVIASILLVRVTLRLDPPHAVGAVPAPATAPPAPARCGGTGCQLPAEPGLPAGQRVAVPVRKSLSPGGNSSVARSGSGQGRSGQGRSGQGSSGQGGNSQGGNGQGGNGQGGNSQGGNSQGGNGQGGNGQGGGNG